MRKVSAIIAFFVLAALIGAACTPAGPAPSQWKVSPTAITVHDGEDNDAGDEPYVMQLGFRSKVGVPGSSSATFASQCSTGNLPAADAGADGTTLTVPAGSADIVLPNVQNLDLGDLALGTAPFEIIGTLTFVAERDGIFDSCAISDALRLALVATLSEALELLIASSATPPTTEDLIALIVDNLGNFLGALGGLIGAVIEGLGNPDDIIGVAVQVHLPTTGALTDLITTGLALGGLFAPGLEQGFIPLEDLPSSLLIKVGPLQNSSSTFRFTTEVADYSYLSTITP